MITKILLLIGLGGFPVSIAYAQAIGARCISLAGAISVLSGDEWAMVHNPAGLAGRTTISCSSCISPGEFGLSELRTIAGSAILPTPGGVLGIGVEQFGYELYGETSIACGAGTEIADGFSGGVSALYRRLTIKGYGSQGCMILVAGGLIGITDQTMLGFQASNVTGTTVGRQHERLPQSFSAGVRLNPSRDFLGLVELEKDVRYPASLKWGIRGTVAELIALSAGVADHPLRYSAGIEIRYDWISVAWAGSRHEVLGWTHQMELTVELSR